MVECDVAEDEKCPSPAKTAETQADRAGFEGNLRENRFVRSGRRELTPIFHEERYTVPAYLI
jgi:hypothetical protein